ncbi:MAG TPA: hypothetical protein VNW68_01960 [Candidatus Limnocylindria bacterium]|jgi:hypothetical protein|nr:hypothetical protein [Candidatus Limnocylindria bacterium]
MFIWRNALILGIGFMAVGVLYLVLQGNEQWMDRAGATFLILLGVAMAFTFIILLRGSRSL